MGFSQIKQLCAPIKYIAFDADDTLWHTEVIFSSTEEKLLEVIGTHINPDDVKSLLSDTERKNLNLFGYGVKGFTLSMIETALELTQYQLSGHKIQDIINLGKEMLCSPLETLPMIPETLDMLKHRYQLLLITKGDLFDQENKIARSGLSDYFQYIDIVSEKKPQTYETILARYEIAADQFLMIGNSPKSDILPVLEIGGRALFVPYEKTWVHEQAEINPNAYPQHFLQATDLSGLREYIASLA